MRPQNNGFRRSLEIKGPWHICFGREKQKRPVIVPASWNEAFPDKRDFLGPAVYTVKFRVPAAWDGSGIFIRFGSVNYIARVRVNGVNICSHEGGSLPFEAAIPEGILRPVNTLEVTVDGNLAPDRVPPGNVPYNEKDAFANTQYPATSFDFFPYCGIHRRVFLCSRPDRAIDDIAVKTSIAGRDGIVNVNIQTSFSGGATVSFTLEGFGAAINVSVPVKHCRATASIRVKRAKFWSPGKPWLYSLTAKLDSYGRPVDEYRLPVGIRTVAIKGSRLLINNRRVFLKGFGRHEDYPGTGRGFSPSWNRIDFKLLKWTGANSFRTSHYPYDEEQMEMADREGIMVIDETPAVGMFFDAPGLKKREELCRRYVRELIARDKNNPSVIMWSLANEPHSKRPGAEMFFKSLGQLARSLDDTRPVTIASYLGAGEGAFRHLDVVCVNRYLGWYSEPGRLDLALTRLSKDLDAIYKKFKRPVILTEFGADALPGRRSSNPEMFTEDYQAAMIKGYLEIAAKKDFVAGAHVWNLCDFKTGQGIHRPGGINWKGVFTREREPKLAARLLRRCWRVKTPAPK
jgi:beta-glucuronidase